MGRNSLKNVPKTKLTLKKTLIYATIVGASFTGVWFILFGTGGALVIPKTAKALPPPPGGSYSLPADSPTGPGGVGTTDGTSSLKIWYRTDAGVSMSAGKITGWTNSAGISDLDLIQTAGNRPAVVSGAVNGYDEISFTSNAHWLKTGHGVLNTNNFITDQASTFVVNRADVTNQASSLYTTEPLVGNSRFSNHLPWHGTIYYDIGTCCSQNARLQVGGLSGLTNYNIWSYDALPSTGKQVYRNGNLLQSRPNTTLYHSHSTQRFRIGRNYKGDVTEVIIFKNKINTAQRLIVENYLSAKFNVGLTTNDLYTQDDAANGDYDHDVAGIGQVDASNIHNDAQGTGIVRFLNPQDLNDGEFFFWGHNSASVQLGNTSDIPSGVDSRIHAVWSVSELDLSGNAIDVGAIDMVWDLSSIGSFSAADLSLLIDSDNDGSFADETPITGATLITGDLFVFEGVTQLSNGSKFTLGVENYTPTLTAAPTGPGGIGVADGNSSLVLWLDASKLNAADGTLVSNWEDQSGYGNDFNAGGGAMYQAQAQNGAAAFNFNGSSHYFERAYDAAITPSEFSIFTAANVSGTNGYKALLSNRDDPPGNATKGFILYATPNSNRWQFWTGRSSGSWQSTSGNTSTAGSWTGIGMQYQPTSGGKVLYLNGAVNASSTHTMTSNTARPMRIGTGRNESSPGYYYKGSIGEVIMYNQVLNEAQRLIIDNYLAAKYGYSLSYGDYYNKDLTANGDFDHEVAGIGRVNASNLHDDAQGTGIVRVLNPSGLGNNEFMFWGHQNGALLPNNANDVPSGVDSRYDRVWAVSEVDASGNAADVGAIDMVFDLTGLGNHNTAGLRLLVDTDVDGSFADETPIAGASQVTGEIYRFSGITEIENDMRFTIGFSPVSSLPIELLDFSAEIMDDEYVQIEWTTASEINNDYFTIEKSTDGVEYEEIGEVKGAGNSSQSITYELEDEELIPGVVYYRLTQTDFDGQFEVFPPKAVEYQKEGSELTIESIGPNPFTNQFTVDYMVTVDTPVELILTTMNGREVLHEFLDASEGINRYTYSDGSMLVPGVYILTLMDEGGGRVSEKIIKE